MTYVETVLYNRHTDERYVLIDVFLCDSLLVHDIDHLDVVIINLARVEPMYLTSDLVVHILLVLVEHLHAAVVYLPVEGLVRVVGVLLVDLGNQQGGLSYSESSEKRTVLRVKMLRNCNNSEKLNILLQK